MTQTIQRKIELRAENESKDMILEGLPIVFDTATTINDSLGTYNEVITANALDGVNLDNIRFLYNHDTNTIPLAKSPKTMALKLTDEGLVMRAKLPNTEQARSVYEAVKREDLSGCSFSFVVAPNGDTFDKETNTRTIHEIAHVHEISIVPFPAYTTTSIEARNQKEGVNNQVKTIAEAFNEWNNKSKEEVDARLEEIATELEGEPEDSMELRNEQEGIIQAKDNINKKIKSEERNNLKFNPINSTQNTEVTNFETTNEVYNSDEYRSAFFKQLQNKDLNAAEKRAMEQANDLARVEKRLDPFNTVTDNAQVIPTQTLNEVVRKARVEGGLLQEARSFNIPANLKIPVGTPFTKAEWHVEGAEVAGEDSKPVSVEFNAYELIKTFSMSASARKMSVQAFESYVTDELVNSVMEALGQALVSGTGKGQGEGLETIDFVAGENLIEYDTPAYTDFTQAMAKLKRGYAKNAKWAMNNATLYNNVYSIVDATDRPIFIADPKAESVGKILGRNVIIDDNIADGEIYLGDFSSYLGYNIPEGVALEVSTQSSFNRGLVDYRALAIADTKVILPEAFIKLAEETI